MNTRAPTEIGELHFPCLLDQVLPRFLCTTCSHDTSESILVQTQAHIARCKTQGVGERDFPRLSLLAPINFVRTQTCNSGPGVSHQTTAIRANRKGHTATA